MKTTKLVLVGAMLSIGTFSAQAQSPDILSSVSPESVDALTKSESSEIRGGYYYCGVSTNKCAYDWSSYEPFSDQWIRVEWKYNYFGNYWVSR